MEDEENEDEDSEYDEEVSDENEEDLEKLRPEIILDQSAQQDRDDDPSFDDEESDESDDSYSENYGLGVNKSKLQKDKKEAKVEIKDQEKYRKYLLEEEERDEQNLEKDLQDLLANRESLYVNTNQDISMESREEGLDPIDFSLYIDKISALPELSEEAQTSKCLKHF